MQNIKTSKYYLTGLAACVVFLAYLFVPSAVADHLGLGPGGHRLTKPDPPSSTREAPVVQCYCRGVYSVHPPRTDCRALCPDAGPNLQPSQVIGTSF